MYLLKYKERHKDFYVSMKGAFNKTKTFSRSFFLFADMAKTCKPGYDMKIHLYCSANFR
jgi:hypothetical protein